jgi:hypothetical protein
MTRIARRARVARIRHNVRAPPRPTRPIPFQLYQNISNPGYVSHVHARFDNHCGRIRVVCNPVEGGRFNPHLIVEI